MKKLYEQADMLLNEPMADLQKNALDASDEDDNAAQNSLETDNFEELLVEIGQNKNKDSFIVLFNHFAPRVKSFLMKGGMHDDTADELAQETMLTVWNNAESFDPSKAAASTWIYTIARNKRIDVLRKQSRIQLSDIEDYAIADKARSPVQNIYCKEKANKITQAMRDLPEEQLALIKKSFFEDKSHSVIAKETGIPLGTVKSRIRIALDSLRQKSGVQELWN